MIRRIFRFMFLLVLAGAVAGGYFTYKYFQLKKEVAEKEKSTPTTEIQCKFMN